MPAGLIGMACGETARFSEPYDSLMNLARPAGWAFRQARSMSIAENWNALARFVLSTDAQWFFLTNDDHIYPPDTLLKLLKRDVDVVTGLYLSRVMPFLPVHGEHVAEDGGIHPWYLEVGARGLVQLQACGDGCLLLKRHVLEAIAEPRWELGAFHRDACDHDNLFSKKVREAGFTIWCDLDVPVGHLAVMPIFPQRDARGNWNTVLMSGQNAFALPAARSPLSLALR